MTKIVLDLHIEELCIAKPNLTVRINGNTYCQVENNADCVVQAPREHAWGEFVGACVTELEATGRMRTAEIYRSAWHNFMHWHDNEDIDIGSVDSGLMKRYESYLRNRGLSLNTISFNMRVLRSCYNKAVEMHDLRNAQPFKNVYTKIGETAKRSLDLASLRRIKDCRRLSRSEAFARDMFLFSLYTRGMSWVDMAYLQHDNLHNGLLCYRRRKTGQDIVVKWELCMQEIVDRYKSKSHAGFLLPIIHSRNGKERNQYRGKQNEVNNLLKAVAVKAGLECRLTMYVARHSWANAAQDLNTPLEVISHALGHTSTKTTRIYLQSIKNNIIDEINTDILKELGA